MVALTACSPRLVEVAPPTTSTSAPPESPATTIPPPDDAARAGVASGAGGGVDRGSDPPDVIEVSPADDVAALVEDAPEDTWFRFTPGEYRGLVIEPRDGMGFVADPGVELTGAVAIEGFVEEDGRWVTQVPVAIRNGPVQGEEWGYCDDDRPACVFPEDLFIEEQQLVRVPPGEPVAAGQWSVDGDSGRLVIGQDPTGREVEMSHAPYAFHGQGDRVTISGFVIERYATPGRQGAINPRTGRLDGAGVDWTVTDNVVRQSHGWGVKLEDGMSVVGNRLEANGQGGIGGVAVDVRVERNAVVGNCVAGFRCFGWEGGGMKLHVDDAVVSGNLVEANLGHGIHTDIGCERVVIDANIVIANEGAGIHHEISGEATITNNRVIGNGFAPGRPTEPGILVLSSSDTQVVGNEVTGNALGIVLRQDDRVDQGILRDVVVRENAIATFEGPAMVFGGSPGDGFDGEWGVRLQIDANRYVYDEDVEMLFRWEGLPVSIDEWLAVGNDPEGSFESTP